MHMPSPNLSRLADLSALIGGTCYFLVGAPPLVAALPPATQPIVAMPTRLALAWLGYTVVARYVDKAVTVPGNGNEAGAVRRNSPRVSA